MLVNVAETVVTGVAALAAVAALGACSNTATKETKETREAASSSVSVSSASAAPSSASTSAQAAAHNNADMMFAHMMIPHHEQAIEMSDIVLGRDDIDPRVVQLASQIKDAQGPEIQQMQGWLKQWGMGMDGMPGHGGMGDMPGHGGMGNMDGMGGMDGMLSAEEMDALKTAEGIDATKLFLTGMIKHHQGAITMSQDEITNGEFPDAVALAKSIVESQQKEIATMNQILGTL